MNTPTRAHPVVKAMELLGGISRPTFYNLVRTGRLKVTKIGKRTVVTDAQIADCLAACGADHVGEAAS